MCQLVRLEGNLLYKQNCTVVHFEMILAMKTQNIYRTIVFDNSLTCPSHVWSFLGIDRLTHEHGRVELSNFDSHNFSLSRLPHPQQYTYTLTMWSRGWVEMRWDLLSFRDLWWQTNGMSQEETQSILVRQVPFWDQTWLQVGFQQVSTRISARCRGPRGLVASSTLLF